MLSAKRADRAGFTLPELLVVVVLLGVVGGAVLRVLVGQQRFYRGAARISDARSQLRQGASVLPAELRGVSASGGDIAALSATAIEFRATTGSAVACQLLSTTEMALPPRTLASGATLASWVHHPEVGDTLHVFDAGANPGSGDDRWSAHRVASFAEASSALCTPAGTASLTSPADDGAARFRVRVTPALPPTVTAGAPIRFTRRVRYRLYQASDLAWYLGYDQYVRGAWGGVQPVSGPYRGGDSAAGERGMELRYFDERGGEVTTIAGGRRIARVDVLFRAGRRSETRRFGAAADEGADSIATAVALRNRQ